MAATLLGGLAVLSFEIPHWAAANVSTSLYGTAAGGWSRTPGAETNPGPTLVVYVGDNVTVHMVSEDNADHGVFIDFNDDGHIEPGTDVSSPTGLDVTFSFIVPAAPGQHYYYCSIHSPNAAGHYAPGGLMDGVLQVVASPSATFAAPGPTTSWTGGTTHNVTFDLTASDPPTSLTIWVNFSYGGGAQGGTIVGPIPGTANPNTVAWATPAFSAMDVRISITALDTKGAQGTSSSTPFEVDSTPPMIGTRLPAPNAANVPLNANVVVTWSEGMATAVSGSTSSFAVQRLSDGAWIAGAVSWSSDGTQMTFSPTPRFDPSTMYRVVVNGSARDDSDPGNRFAGPDSWPFTTGTGVDTTPPTILNVAVNPTAQVTGATVSIRADAMDDVAVASVSAHVQGPGFDANLTMVYGGGTSWYANRTYGTEGNYSFTAWAVDGTGNAASRSGFFSITAAPVPAPTGVLAHVLSDGTIHVIWSPVTGGTIAGYNIYRATAATGPFARLTPTPLPSSGPAFYIDRTAQPGVMYYYVVRAVDVNGQESPPSAVVTARVPGTAIAPAPDNMLTIVAGGAVAVAGIAIAILWWRKKK